MSSDKSEGYLQFGKAGEPMYTKKVTVKMRDWPHAGEWIAHYEGRWRVVHMQKKRMYIICDGVQINILIDGV